MWGWARVATRARPLLWSVLVFSVVAGITAGLSYAADRMAAATVVAQNRLLLGQIGERIRSCAVMRVELVRTMQRERELGGLRDEGAFAARVEAIMDAFPGYLAINGIDRDGFIVRVHPEAPNRRALGQSVFANPRAAAALRRAIATNETTLTEPLDLFQGGRGVVVYVPAAAHSASLEILNGVFRTDVILQTCLGAEGLSGQSLSVTDGEALLFERRTSSFEPLAASALLPVLNRTWTVRLAPSVLMVERAARPARLLLLGGLVLAASVAVLLFGLLTARARGRAHAQRSEAENRQHLDERRELEVQLQQAQKMEALGRLAGGVAHDFNNLLSIILLDAEILQRGIPPEEQGELLDEIVDAGQRAAGLTKQLLGLGRSRPVAFTAVDLGALVRTMRPLLARLVRSDVELDVCIDEAPSELLGNVVQLEQIVVNLVMNAVDAMPSGGRLTVEVGSDNEHVRLRIEDTGAGVPSEIAEQIFEPFFTTKEVGAGTGLGLATVYGNVRRMNGEIRLESPPGKGASFDVRFPVCTGASPLVGEAHVVGAKRDRRLPRRVLLVEDLPSVRTSLARMLRRSGIDVVEAQDGTAAVALLQDTAAGAPDIVLSDVVMPRMGGVELLTWVRTHRPKLPMVLMSGYSGNALAGLGMLDVIHLDKPVTEVELLAALGDAIAKH